MSASRKLPAEISHYRILEPIGTGGMGDVYLAEDLRLHRRVALKILPQEAIVGRELQRFRLEARTASALNHPNIVTIHEIDQRDGYEFIAQEHVSGHTIRDLIADGPLSPEQTVEIAIGVASALVAAHAADVVHRDIKPENVMVRDDGLVKVLDFGLAKLISARQGARSEDQDDRFSTDPGAVMGTFNYMSPEQVLTFELDQRSDIFSLGILMYEMVTGKAPFARDTRGDTVKAILFDEPPSLSSEPGEIPQALVEIIETTIKKERDERMQTSAELLGRLLELKTELGPSSSLSDGLLRQAGVRRGILTTLSEEEGISSVFGLVALVRAHRGTALLAAIMFMSALGFVHYLSGVPRPIESIAIVPFDNQGEDSRTEYFAVGLTQEITQRLAQISNLKVLAHSTMDEYRGTNSGATEIGRELGVDAIVKGSVTSESNDVRVTVEMVDVRLGTQLWGDTYRRSLSDLFMIQESIARDISNKLRLRISGEEEERITRRLTQSSEAYDEYLHGRYVSAVDGRRNCEQAIRHFARAVERDPGFAQAYVGLADCYNILGSYSEIPPEGAFPAAREYANKALRLDNSLASAHIALAYTLQNYDWDWKGAEREYLRAFDLEPSHATGRYWYGGFLMLTGRFDEARQQRSLAHSLDPLSITFRTGQGTPYLLARDHNEAIRHYKRAIRVDPAFAQAHRSLAWAYLFKGDLEEEAINEIMIAERLSGRDPDRSPELAYAYAVAGNEPAARSILDNLSGESERYVSPYDLALVHVALREHEDALRLLDAAVRERSNRVTALKVEPALDPLREDPRFEALLWKTGLHLSN